MKSTFFGDIDLNNLQECYDSEIELNGNKIQIDLWFEEQTINENIIIETDNFLVELQKYVEYSKQEIENNQKSKNVVKEYLEHHLEEFDESEKLSLGIDLNDDITTQLFTLYKKLHLVRVGIYPTNAMGAEFAILDYTIDEELTNYLIVVNMKKNGEISDITFES